MKRDMDLARDILLQLEAADDPGKLVELAFLNRSDGEIQYHLMLLAEAGLIEAVDASPFGSTRWIPRRLTWAGHEFLDAARDATRWERAKKIVKQRTGSLSFDTLKAVIARLALDAIIPD